MCALTALSPRPHAGPSVVLLSDWENLKIGLWKSFHTTPSVPALVEAAQRYGQLVLAHAYADWTLPTLRHDASTLYRYGVEPVFVPASYPGSSQLIKNSADIRLAVDAVSLAGDSEPETTFMLATGDRDLIHVVHHLRMRGCRVVVVSVGDAMSSLLAEAADDVLRYEQDIIPLEPCAPNMRLSSTRPTPPASPLIEEAFAILTDILPSAPSPHFPDVQAAVEARLGQRIASLGFEKLSHFYQAAVSRGLAVIEQLPNGGWVVLPPGGTMPKVVDAGSEPLNDAELQLALRVLLTVEDNCPEQLAQRGSLQLHLRHSLPQLGGPKLGSSAVVRLLESDLVNAGYVQARTLMGVDRETQQPRLLQAYQLDRSHPTVIAAMAAGPVELDPTIEVRPLVITTNLPAVA